MQTTTAFLIISLVTIGCSSSTTTSSDPRTEATALARDDLPCTSDADCCVVFDGCLNDAYVVSAKDKDKVASLLASADKSRCTGCIAPSTQVSCGPSGYCVGAKIECTGSLFSAGEVNHCGKLALPAGCAPKAAAGGPAPAPATKTILHCG
jgi:hypothetical protein